ncbi:MAG TPA: tetratricopeptide repeat protein [Planctomycetaceae bacterium]|nr:tetratricopeptide repeat protein [Planctomycetaceae bacterium]
MTQPTLPVDSKLAGAIVVFTGRLAAMTRVEAVDLVQAHGGVFARAVSSHTRILVVGEEGWPLKRDGRLTRKLSLARSLQHRGRSIEILREAEFFDRLGVGAREEDVSRHYTLAQLTRILGIRRDRLRAWIRAGLIRPVEVVHRLAYFDFREVTSAKALCALSAAGIPTHRLRKSLEQLHAVFPQLSDPIAQLELLEGNRLLAVELEGRLVEPHGQMLFDFREHPETEVLTFTAFEAQASADVLLERALEAEEQGEPARAVEIYQTLLLREGPQPELCFNLGNALYAAGQREAARERFRQAVELDAEYVEAWNNLGNVLSETGQRESAIEAFERALELDPHYSDAHFNLAETLTELGRREQARPHWQTYLKYDHRSEWSTRARRQLANELA